MKENNVEFSRVFIIIPAYNEAESIGRVIRGLFEQGFKNVVVVDDGSLDSTAQCARASGAHVLRHMLNRGQGAALQTGNEFALRHNADYLVHFDGDGQFNPHDIAPALRTLSDQNLDIVLGSRFLDKRSQLPFSKRFILLPLARIVNYLLTGMVLSDVHNGFRIFTKKVAQQLVITQDRMAHNSEICVYIKKNKLRFLEIPVEVRYVRYGQGVGGGLKILKEWFLGYFVK